MLPKIRIFMRSSIFRILLLYMVTLLKNRYMTEKYDGIRAYWDGKGKFYSRLGKEIKIPDWFSFDLPSIPLDGELWYL